MDRIAAVLPAISWETATFVDAGVLLVTLFCAALGFWSGFVWQILRLLAWIGAIWLAGRFHGVVAGWLGESFTSDIRSFLGFIAVFLAVLVLGHIIGHLARSAIDTLQVTFMDRLLGTVLGSIKGLLLCGALALATLKYLSPDSPLHSLAESSQLATYCAKITAFLWIILPGTGPT